jgi:hypothetical protein
MALFNKHPDTSILVKFDQNGNLVTLKGEAYTPTGVPLINHFFTARFHGFSAIRVDLHLQFKRST